MRKLASAASLSLVSMLVSTLGCGDDTSETGSGAASSSATPASGPASSSTGQLASTSTGDGGAGQGGDTTSSSQGGAGTGGSGGSGGGAGAGEIGPGAAVCARPDPGSDPVCEAIGGSCYYVDPVDGDDDAGDGSFESPWRSLANVVSYYGTPGSNGSTTRPDSAIDLQPGDVVYLFGGTYDDLYNYDGSLQIARFRGLDGEDGARFRLAAYPGQTPVFDAGGETDAIVLTQSSFWDIDGMEIANAYGNGLRVEESDEVTVSHVHIHDTDGVDNDNIAGLHLLGSTNVDVGCSELHDNYDHENADTGGEATENSSNVVLFGGGNIRIHHSRVFQTPEPTAAKTGGCIKYKHAATLADGTFEVDHNDISSCKFFAVGTGTQHSHVHHNLIRGGETIVSRDFGGPTHQTDQRFDHNTIYRAAALDLSPTDGWNDETFDDPQSIVFERNVVVHDLASPSQERGIVVIGTYASDDLYDATFPELTFAANCYFNPSGVPSFALFAANGGDYGEEGAQYTFDDWQALGFDSDAVNADPMFVDADGGDLTLAEGSPCAAMGAYAE